MRCFTHLILGLLIFAVVQDSSAQHSPAAATEPDESGFVGSFRDGKYTNPFFRFALDFPPRWIKFDDVDKDAAKKMGTDALKTDNIQLNKKLEQASDAEVVLVAFGAKPVGSIENSAIAMGAAKQPSAYTTPKMVAEASKSLLLKNAGNKLIQDVKTEIIGGKEFARFDIELAISGQKIPLRFYATMVRDYSITVSMSSLDKQSFDQMETALRSIRFWK